MGTSYYFTCDRCKKRDQVLECWKFEGTDPFVFICKKCRHALEGTKYLGTEEEPE